MPTRMPPSFGGKLHQPEYYSAILRIIAGLKPMSSLSTIAAHLNSQSFKTPKGYSFTADNVMNFIRYNRPQGI